MLSARISALITICLIPVYLLSIRDAWGAVNPLDEEIVFCIYFKLSGNSLDAQDIEEFCYESGRPAFTAFKPSEMFMKNSVREHKIRLEEKIKQLKDNLIFTWKFSGIVVPNDLKKNDYNIMYDENDLPQPTPFINAELSKDGRRSLRVLLNSLVNRKFHSMEKKEFEISVWLLPQSIAFRYQKRNIAHEDVLLPIRYVIFHPIKVQALDETMTIKESIN